MTPFDSLEPSLQHISSLGRFIHFWAGEVDGCLQRFALMRSTCKFYDEFLKVPLISTAFLHGPVTLRAWPAPDISDPLCVVSVASACSLCDRNVHDPSTLRDVSALPQIILYYIILYIY